MTIHLALRLLAGSSCQPGLCSGRAALDLYGIAPSEVYLASLLPGLLVRSYRTLSALPVLGPQMSASTHLDRPKPRDSIEERDALAFRTRASHRRSTLCCTCLRLTTTGR